ncbi:22235_t:CDS:2, partial [Racocetra persica]
MADKKITNWSKGHAFEDALRKLFNDNRIIAHIIQVSEGDGELDLLLSYQGNQICVQSKDRENALTLSMIKDFEATMIHFKSSLGILVYNSEMMKTEKYLTKQAKLWLDNSTQELIVCNEKQVVEKIKNFFKNEKDSIEELILTDFKADKFSLMGIISENTTKKTKIIVFTGTIGVGKTTCAKLFEAFLKTKGFTINHHKELSLQVIEEFHIFKKDKPKNFLFFQYILLHHFKQQIYEIKKNNFSFLWFLWKVDYIILDRTQKDMKIFNKIFQDPSEKEYIDKKVNAIEPLNFYKVVFVTVLIKMSIERQQKRARLGELVDREYLEILNAYYLEDIDLVYPKNLNFENIVNLCGDDCAQCL